MAFLALGVLLTACREEEDFGIPKISLDKYEASLDKTESSATVTLNATRDWYIANAEKLADWIAVNPSEGKASNQPQTVTVTVNANAGYNRTGEVVFSIGLAKATLAVHQNGEKGELSLGSGTKDDPYTVAGVIAYVQGLGKDVESPSNVFFKGIVDDVTTTFAASGTYGNATFYIVDPEGSDRFYCFQTYYLGNRKWKSGDTEVQKGDEVIMCGKVVNYKGNTPETVGKGASFIYSLNGKSEGGGDTPTPGSAKGSGTLADPYNPAGAAAYAQSLGSDVQSPGNVYIKGKISEVGTTFEASGNYGNATFTIVDAEDGTGSFYIFQTYYLGNRKWKSGDTEVKVGDEVIICGPVVNFRGNTPETAGKGASYIYSLNGNTGGETPGPGPDPGTASGSGTAEDPYNVAAAIDAVKGLTWTNKDTYDKIGPYYVKGKVAEVTEQFGAQFGNCTFTIKDDGSDATFTAYRILYLGNRKWAEGDKTLKAGDEVIVYGELMNYHGDTPETVQGSAYLYSLNGDTTGETPGPGPGPDPGTASGTGTLEDPFNVAAALDAVKDLTWTDKDNYDKVGPYYVKGKVTAVTEQFGAQFGNCTFKIADDGSDAVFTAYRILYLGNRKWVDGDKTLKAGDEVIVYGELMNYHGDTPETVQGSAYLYSLNGDTTGEGGDPGTGEDPGQGEEGDFSTNVTWDNLSSAYSEEATVNGTSGVAVLKLGTSSKTGSATINFSSASKLTFYALSWNAKPSELIIKAGGTEVGRISPAANSGLANKSPYTLTVSDTDKYSVNLGSAVTSVTVETTGSNTRVALFGIKTE